MDLPNRTDFSSGSKSTGSNELSFEASLQAARTGAGNIDRSSSDVPSRNQRSDPSSQRDNLVSDAGESARCRTQPTEQVSESTENPSTKSGHSNDDFDRDAIVTDGKTATDRDDNADTKRVAGVITDEVSRTLTAAPDPLTTAQAIAYANITRTDEPVSQSVSPDRTVNQKSIAATNSIVVPRTTRTVQSTVIQGKRLDAAGGETELPASSIAAAPPTKGLSIHPDSAQPAVRPAPAPSQPVIAIEQLSVTHAVSARPEETSLSEFIRIDPKGAQIAVLPRTGGPATEAIRNSGAGPIVNSTLTDPSLPPSGTAVVVDADESALVLHQGLALAASTTAIPLVAVRVAAGPAGTERDLTVEQDTPASASGTVPSALNLPRAVAAEGESNTSGRDHSNREDAPREEAPAQQVSPTGTPHSVRTDTAAAVTPTIPQNAAASVDRAHLVQQLTRHIESVQAANGRGEISLNLTPEHLGALRLTIVRDAGNVSARIVVETAQAHQAVDSAREHLRTALENRGLTLESLDVSLNRNPDAGGQFDRRQDAGSTYAQSRFPGVGAPQAAQQAIVPILTEVRHTSRDRLDTRA